MLTAEVEKKLGKRLTTPDVGVLLGLNDYLGLPADVIFLLVNHCVERITRTTGQHHLFTVERPALLPHLKTAHGDNLWRCQSSPGACQ